MATMDVPLDRRGNACCPHTHTALPGRTGALQARQTDGWSTYDVEWVYLTG
jgi:hypothetical protein